MTALLLASEHGHLGIVKSLLDKGANIETKDETGMTPLHLASENGNLEVIDLLIKFNAKFQRLEPKHKILLSR